MANALAWVLGAATPDTPAYTLLPSIDAKSDPDFVIITETDNFHSTDPGIDRVHVRLRKSVFAPNGRLLVRLGGSPAP